MQSTGRSRQPTEPAAVRCEMEAVREIRQTRRGRITVDVPAALRNRMIEVILLPLGDERPLRKRGKTLRGALGAYANPALWRKESGAWRESVGG